VIRTATVPTVSNGTPTGSSPTFALSAIDARGARRAPMQDLVDEPAQTWPGSSGNVACSPRCAEAERIAVGNRAHLIVLDRNILDETSGLPADARVTHTIASGHGVRRVTPLAWSGEVDDRHRHVGIGGGG
jgi:hypothetical protein